eukprot:5491816-Amphidinium_carterae.1
MFIVFSSSSYVYLLYKNNKETVQRIQCPRPCVATIRDRTASNRSATTTATTISRLHCSPNGNY